MGIHTVKQNIQTGIHKDKLLHGMFDPTNSEYSIFLIAKTVLVGWFNPSNGVLIGQKRVSNRQNKVYVHQSWVWNTLQEGLLHYSRSFVFPGMGQAVADTPNWDGATYGILWVSGSDIFELPMV